jgi:O-antigen ligase
VGPHFSPNHTALYLERSLFVGLAGLALIDKRRRMVVAAVLLALAAALVLTGSRGALFLAVPAGLATFAGFLLYRRPAIVRWLRMRRRPLLSTMVALAALLALILFWQQERLANLQTVELRLTLWTAAFALWREHFWVGVGPGGFFWTYPAYLPVGAVEVDQLHPHNVWLELTTTWGVLGLAWFVLCVLALRAALRRRVNGSAAGFWVAAGACAGLVAGLAHAQTDAFMLLADLAMWNAVAWALATAPDR